MDRWLNDARQALLRRRRRLQETVSTLEHQELRNIEDALARMEEGAYGRCIRCDGPLGRHRLRAVPEARHCLTCSAQEVR